MTPQEILNQLPYEKPFLFVDEILEVNASSIIGTYRFYGDLEFYKGHFKGNPVTPGVILIETMAQIGLVSLGIYLMGETLDKKAQIALTSAEAQFLKPVFPGEKVTVIAEKIYFRFGKLKCSVRMSNEENIEVCTGIISGIVIN